MTTTLHSAPPVTRLRRTDAGWEEILLDLLHRGEAVTVVAHKDPRPRLARLARWVSPGTGHRLPDRPRYLLAVSLRQAAEEGEAWVDLAGILGLPRSNAGIQAARYYAGVRGAARDAKLYGSL